MLTLEDPARFPTSRDVGAYVGLVPKRSASGQRDPQLGITRAGDRMLRRLLVQAAHYTLGPFGPDTDLRRFGEKLAARGGKNAKKRAIVAVARKLAVLLHSLWSTGEVYEPLRHHPQEAQEQEAASRQRSRNGGERKSPQRPVWVTARRPLDPVRSAGRWQHPSGGPEGTAPNKRSAHRLRSRIPILLLPPATHGCAPPSTHPPA